MVEELQPPVELLTFHPNDGKVVFLHLAVPWSCVTCGRGYWKWPANYEIWGYRSSKLHRYWFRL